MAWWVLGGVLMWAGGVMMARGWSYSLKPDGPRALRRKARNVELGFPTDMRLFGKKVRRLGLMIALVGIVISSVPWW